MTATATALDSIAAEFGITLVASGKTGMRVLKDGKPVRRVSKGATTELTLARVLLDHLHHASHPQEWATVMAALRPDTTAEEWLAVADKLNNQ